MTDKHPWRDRDHLYEKYIVEDESQRSIADEWGCNKRTIHDWIEKHDIPKKNRGGVRRDHDVYDEEMLRELYWGEGLSQAQIAEELGVSEKLVYYEFERHEIETRMAYNDPLHPPSYRVGGRGYPTISTHIDGSSKTVKVHRLLAVAEYGWDEVVGKEVHHINHIPWDNRPGNIGLMDPSEHRRYHNKMKTENASERERLRG